MTAQPKAFGPLRRSRARLLAVWHRALSRETGQTWSKPSGQRLIDQRKDLNWGRLLHLAQKERAGNIGRQEKVELRDLRNRQHGLNHRPLLAWFLRDGWR